jgi:hypothetical protein
MIVDGVIAAYLALLCVLTVPYQLTRWRERHYRLSALICAADVLGLLPRWTFFAPHPATRDYHLLCREFNAGRWQSWVEIPLITGLRYLSHVFWNPEKREKKAFVDSINQLSRLAERAGPSLSVQLSGPYLALLRLVTAHAMRSSEFVQFAIGTTQRSGTDLSFLFVSESHALHDT